MKTASSIFLAVIAFGLLACGGGTTTETVTTPAATDAAPATDTAAAEPDAEGGGSYPAEVRENYLEGCTQQASQETCECTLAYLEKNLSVEDFASAGIKINEGGEPPKELLAASAECV